MVHRKYYKIENDTLSVLECGNLNHPVIIFLHGIPASAELWRDTMIEMSNKGFFCLAPDLSGYGETEIIHQENYELTKFSRLLVTFFKQKNLKNIQLVAHDIGGGIAQILVANNEELFKKVILSNCVTGSSWPIPSIQKMIKASKIGVFYWLAFFGMFKADKFYKTLSNSFYNKKLSKKDFERIFYDGKFTKSSKIYKFQKMLKVLHNSHTSKNMEALQKINVPVDLIWAMKDKFQPWQKSGLELKSTIKHSQVFQISNSGHYLQIDAPNEYIALLSERLV